MCRCLLRLVQVGFSERQACSDSIQVQVIQWPLAILKVGLQALQEQAFSSSEAQSGYEGRGAASSDPVPVPTPFRIASAQPYSGRPNMRTNGFEAGHAASYEDDIVGNDQTPLLGPLEP